MISAMRNSSGRLHPQIRTLPKRSNSLLVVYSIGLAGALAYLAGAQQPLSHNPISLSVVSPEGSVGGGVHGWILCSDGSVTKVDLPATIGR